MGCPPVHDRCCAVAAKRQRLGGALKNFAWPCRVYFRYVERALVRAMSRLVSTPTRTAPVDIFVIDQARKTDHRELKLRGAAIHWWQTCRRFCSRLSRN